ncbi:hypothetical protein [Kordia sp. SMS9]|uniref:hypothetical protein n=1 Tax=Kordia sp. SMS9 TaxID=2282170 RepID=UPI0013B3C3F3|nr:hypothetical protein [Kordia sp. SMS9]
MKKNILSQLKELPAEIKAVLLYNSIQTLVVLYIIFLTFPSSLFFGVFVVLVLTLNYFLIIRKKAAWVLMLIWLMAITFSFNFTIGSVSIWFDFYYGFQTSLMIGSDNALEQYIRLDFLALIFLFIHISSRKYFKKKTVIDEIDDIAKNTDI